MAHSKVSFWGCYLQRLFISFGGIFLCVLSFVHCLVSIFLSIEEKGNHHVGTHYFASKRNFPDFIG